MKQNTGLATSAFSLRGPLLFKDAKDAMLQILSMLDEPSPREMGDLSLISDMNIMNEKLQQWSDDDICNQIRAMRGLKSNDDTKKKRNVILISLYAKLAHIFHFVDQVCLLLFPFGCLSSQCQKVYQKRLFLHLHITE